MTRLAAFEDAFGKALFVEPGSSATAPLPPDVAAFARQPAFAVYRNTVVRGLVDAIVANHPAVARLVGDEWIRAAATAFARAHPPRHPMLLDYGEGFDRFLAGFAPAADLPWLPGVAALDRAWTEAHAARDDALVDPGEIAVLAPDRLADARLVPHAAARWTWSDDMPVFTLWSRNRDPDDDADLSDIAWHGEGALLTRPRDTVRWRGIGAAHCAFLDACAAGDSLAGAAAAAVGADGDIDLARLMADLLDAGAFARLDRAAAGATDTFPITSAERR